MDLEDGGVIDAVMEQTGWYVWVPIPSIRRGLCFLDDTIEWINMI